ncbi:type II secretion system minor pseudopilin GspK [Massilia sp. METH4]|uniref:type II secretion system minor pseudopilin GspK n=1 Tax=Massilia sp. METH4 TaxID=3123041 RepID=UPI0030D588AC
MKRGLKRQRGVAVVTALLLTTLAVTIVASLFWQQQVQVRSVENQRLHLQTRWILRGALDWARLILRQDGLDNPSVTRADGVWATPLAETRLDQYVERERVEGEDYDATLQGQIVDAQSRYNLSNLADRAGAIDQKETRAFQQLLTLLQLDGNLAQAAAQQVAKAAQAKAQQGSSAPMPVQRLEDLLVAGFPQAAVERLREYVVVLPRGQGVNLNTAPAEVIAALFEGMPLSEAQSAVTRRKGAPIMNAADIAGSHAVLGLAAARSDYFLVLSQVRLDRAALESWALIKRESQQDGYRTSLVWIREI